MTLLDIRNQLIGHFCKEDTFKLDDFTIIKIDDDTTNDQKDGMVRAALKQLVEAEMVTEASKDFWILTVPLGSAGQQVDVPIEIAQAIADCINTYAKANELPIDPVDALNIHAGHLASLVGIINDLVTE